MTKLMPTRSALRDPRVFQSVYGYTSGWRTLHARYLADGALPTIPPRWERREPVPTPVVVRPEITVKALAAELGVKVFAVIASGAPIGLHLEPETRISLRIADWLRERLKEPKTGSRSPGSTASL
jgi:hypothetical protein